MCNLSQRQQAAMKQAELEAALAIKRQQLLAQNKEAAKQHLLQVQLILARRTFLPT